MMILGWLLAALQILTRILSGSFGNKSKVPEEASLVDLTTDLTPDVAIIVVSNELQSYNSYVEGWRWIETLRL